MDFKDAIYYAVLFHSKKSERTIANDFALEIYENADIASAVLKDYFSFCDSFFSTTSEIAHLNYPGVQESVLDLMNSVDSFSHQQTVKLVREWISLESPEKQCAISGFAYTGIKNALRPKKFFLLLATRNYPQITTAKTFSKVEINDGWVREIDNNDSCPLLGCVPIGEDYVSWRLYKESTFVPILGFIDFCRNQNVQHIIDQWLITKPENSIAKVLRAIIQIENIEIVRNSLFI